MKYTASYFRKNSRKVYEGADLEEVLIERSVMPPTDPPKIYSIKRRRELEKQVIEGAHNKKDI